MPVIGRYPLLRGRASSAMTGTVADPPTTPGDDLTTWPSSGSFTTLTLPGTPPLETQDENGDTVFVPQDTPPYFLVFEVTRALPAAAIAATPSLRFTGTGGVRLGHLRTASGRIFIGGVFLAGLPITITYYWGKAGQTQPGEGFPTSAQLLAPFRLFLIFESSNPIDYSANPATFTKIGAPTFVTGLNGQAMMCGDGNYIQTTAAKLRGDARTSRHAMALTLMPDSGGEMRTVSWANWAVDPGQRAYQLWGHGLGIELYIDDNGASPFQRWTNPTPPVNGWNWIGGSWTSGVRSAIVQSNEDVREMNPDFIDGPTPGDLHNSTAPYVFGGTPVAGIFHAGGVESEVELLDATTPSQHRAWFWAWRENAMFVGEDRAPDVFSIPSLTNVERSIEVGFAAVQITGISPSTQITVNGPGNPSFAVSSSSSVLGDVRAKGTGTGTISNGQWVKVWQTSSASYATSVIDTLTVGTLSVNFQSSTKAEPGVIPPTLGSDGIPTGTATYTVTSLSALHDVINNQLQGGQIVQIASGDYKSEGALTISGKNFGDIPAVIRSDIRAYRGPHPSEGGLWVDREGPYETGSKGAEFRGIYVRNSQGVVLDGLRSYEGATTADWIHYFENNTNLVVRNCIIAGLRASGYISGWVNGTGYTWSTEGVPKGFWISNCASSRFEKCLFQHWIRGFWFWGTGTSFATGTTFEDCVWNNQGGDHLYTSAANSWTTYRRCIWGQMFPSTATFHKDHYQCTSVDLDAARDQLIELCIMGPLLSPNPHIQGVFLEQDNWPTRRGVERVHVKDTLVESRAQNAIYMRPSKDSIVERCTVIKNQFGGSSTTQRDSIWNNPLVNFNASGLSQGGNVLLNSVVGGTGLGGSDTSTGNLTLNEAQYPAELFDYPLYSAGIWRPVLYLTEKACVDATELKRMAPAALSTYHPDQAGDKGAWRVFDYYGALP